LKELKDQRFQDLHQLSRGGDTRIARLRKKLIKLQTRLNWCRGRKTDIPESTNEMSPAGLKLKSDANHHLAGEKSRIIF